MQHYTGSIFGSWGDLLKKSQRNGDVSFQNAGNQKQKRQKLREKLNQNQRFGSKGNKCYTREATLSNCGIFRSFTAKSNEATSYKKCYRGIENLKEVNELHETNISHGGYSYTTLSVVNMSYNVWNDITVLFPDKIKFR